jgi:hypothetical protein
MEAKEDVAHGINIHCRPPSFSPTPNSQADCQFIFYGEQHALLPPSVLAGTIGFADTQSYHGGIAIAILLLPILLLSVVFVVAFSDAYAHAVADPVAAATAVRHQATATTTVHSHCRCRHI